MTEAEVRARVVVFADGSSDPALTSADLDVIVSMSKTADKYGAWPTDSGWSETYNVNYAIAQAWLLKSSRLAQRYLFMSGGKMFSRQQYYDHCMKQYKIYAMKAGVSAQKLSRTPLGLGVVPNNANA